MARIGGLEVETKISLQGFLALCLIIATMIGGWRHFADVQEQEQQEIVALQEAQKSQIAADQAVVQMMDYMKSILATELQAMEDHGWHVRPSLPPNTP